LGPGKISLEVPGPEVKARIIEAYGRLPLYFIANQGQVSKDVAYYEKSSGHATFFTRKEIVLR
jgi:hypothetical protein